LCWGLLVGWVGSFGLWWEVERNQVQERTRESVEHRRRTGGNLGGRPQLADGRRVLVRRLRAEGKSYREVAETCGVSLATAHRYGKGWPDADQQA